MSTQIVIGSRPRPVAATPPRRRGGRGHRRGVTTLVAALGALGVLGFLGAVQFSLSRQAAGEVQRVQLSALARLQARSAAQELMAQVHAQVNEPGTALFRALREALDPKDPQLTRDITGELTAPTETLEPGWGRKRAAAAEGRGAARVVSYEVKLRGGRRAADPLGSEEWVGLCTVRVVAEVGDSALRVRRELEENYELRAVLVAPPRPFDQLGLFLGRHDVVLDAAGINAARRALLADIARIYEGVRATDRAGFTPAQAAKLEAIAAGMVPPDEVARRTPEMPAEPAALWGFYHTGEYYLAGLSLLPMVRRLTGEMARHEAAARAAAGDNEARIAALYDLVAASSAAVNALWDYQRVMNVRPHDSAAYRESVEPYLARLTPGYFLDRAHLVIHPDDPVFARWRAGESRLEGVLDLTRLGTKLRLRGELRGRVMLVVGPEGVELEDVNPAGSGPDRRLVIVSLGGDVEVRGTAGASVLMLGPEGDPAGAPGATRIPFSATLRGNLVVPRPRAAGLQLDGKIRYDGRLRAAWPPQRTLYKAGRGDYLVAISPRPLFAEGRAR